MILKILTKCCEEGDRANNDCAEVMVNAGLESFENVDSLEHNDMDSTPLLDKLQHQADQQGLEVTKGEEH